MESNSDDSGFEEQTAKKQDAPKPSEMLFHRTITLSETAPALPLTGFDHSLVPDMAMGWRPTSLKGGPIPLVFNRCDLPVSHDHTTKKEFVTVYHGFRPRDTMVMHQTLSDNAYPAPHYPSSQVYEYLNKRDQRLQDPRPFQGMNPESPGDLLFDSCFESGNLDRVVRLSPTEFDLYLRVDSNTAGHFQWYYFGVLPEKTMTARFNILNFSRNEGQYSQGMLPLVFLEDRPAFGWHHAGFDPKHGPSKLNRKLPGRGYNSFSFSYAFRKDVGKVFFAYSVPYTYSFLIRTIREVSTAHAGFVRRGVVGKTLSGLELPSLTITNFSSGEQKPHIILAARVHPGETNSSWMLHVTATQGLIQYAVSSSPSAATLREKAVLVFVPMVNPDGVIIGNFKTGLAGDDLNRQFSDPQVSLHPTVIAVTSLVEQLKKDKKVVAFLDFHAHSKKKFVFLYGPHYPLHAAKYYRIRVLPKLICEKGPQFRYSACRFRTEKRSHASARAVMCKEQQIMYSYTVEASCYGYLSEEREIVSFTHEGMEDSGRRVGEALAQWILLKEQQKKKRLARRGFRRHKNGKHLQALSEVPAPISMEDIIRQIKEEEKAVQTQQVESSSDSESSDEELEEQRRIKGEILAAVEMFEKVPKVPIVALRPVWRRERDTSPAPATEGSQSARRLPRATLTPPLLPRKPDPEHILQPKLYAPVMPVRMPVEDPVPRSVSVLHRVQLGHQQGLLSIRKSSPDIKPAFMRCPQNGFRESSQDVRLPAAVQKVEGLWQRHSARPHNLVNPILIKPIRHENGAVTERMADRPSATRPRTTLRIRMQGAAIDN